MSELLTSEEIDTLLELFRAEGGGLAPKEEQLLRAAVTSKPKPVGEAVDLLTVRRFAPRHRVALERAFGTIDRSLARALGRLLRAQPSCECVAVERLRWNEWASRARSPMQLFQLGLEPLARRGLMALSTDFLSGAIDRLLGGSGRVSVPQTRFSDAEAGVADGLLRALLSHLAEALSPFVAADPKIDRRVADLELARFVREHDPVLAVRYELVAGPVSGELRFVLPFHEIEKRVRESTDRSDGALRAARASAELTDAVRGVPLRIRVVLGRAELPLRELLALRAGDVVRLGTRVGEPVEGLIQGRRKLRGWVGPHNGRMALRVTGAHGEGKDERT